MGRPSGTVVKATTETTLFAALAAGSQRNKVTRFIGEGNGISRAAADKASEHLRWALEQLESRGWTNKDWGQLFQPGGELGVGPVCILESVRAPFDCPSKLRQESLEQKYIRLALATFGITPAYVSMWNDRQTEFEPIRTVLLRAIELAEEDEEAGKSRFPEDQAGLMALFGLTVESILAEAKAVEQDLETQPTSETPTAGGGGATGGPVPGDSPGLATPQGSNPFKLDDKDLSKLLGVDGTVGYGASE